MNKFTSRKFWTMVSCILLFTGLLIASKIDQTVYQVLVMFLLGSYFTANVMEKKHVAD